ncbi:MAG: TolC family protein, partial [Flavobacterium sp.]
LHIDYLDGPLAEGHSVSRRIMAVLGRAEASTTELHQRILQNSAQMRIEQSRLKLLLNLKEDFSASDTTFVPVPFAATDTSAVTANPEYRLAQNKVAIAEALRKVEQASLFPDITGGYFIQSITGNQDLNGTPRYYNNSMRFQGFTVGLSVPLFFGSTSAKTKAAKINVERERQQSEYVRAQLSSRVIEQNEQLATSTALVSYYRDTAEPNARKIITNATKGYQNGDMSYVEYVQSLDTANEILVNYADAIRQYNQTVINIQFLINQ